MSKIQSKMITETKMSRNDLKGRQLAYAKSASIDPQLLKQLTALEDHDIPQDSIFIDYKPGRYLLLDGFNNLMNQANAGDTVTTYSLENLGNNINEMIHLIDIMHNKQLNLYFIKENIRTDSILGKHFRHLLFAIAESEKTRVFHRINKAKEIAQVQGKKPGRKPKICKKKIKSLKEQGYNPSEISRKLKCSRQYVYKLLG